jgi:hypothetical protein
MLVVKLERKRSVGRPRRRLEDGIKMDLRGIGFAGMDFYLSGAGRD